jgi:ABC-2 type transport system permease protein
MRGGVRSLGQSFVATWRAMLGDFGALLLLFVGGIIYSFFYPLPYAHETVQRVPVAVVDQDHSALSRQIIRYVQAHPALSLQQVVSEPGQAQELLWRNDIAGMLLIPAGLNAKVLAGRPAEVELAGNGLYMMLNKAALNGLAEVVGTVSAGVEVKRLMASTPSTAQALAQRQPLGLNAVALFNVREGYGSYVVPGVAVLIIQQTLLMAVAMLLGSWVERGVQPVPRSTAGYLGALAAFASVPALNCAYYFGFVMWWQDYPRGGNALGLAVFTLLFSFCLAALAMAIGLLFRTRERSAQLLLGTAMPLMFLSGLSWPVQAMPPLLQALRWLSPSTAGIQGFVALNQLGATLHEVRWEMASLLAIACVAALLGWWCWRRPGA